MDDLSGLNWSSSSPNEARKPPPMNSGLLFPTVKRNDASGRSTPVSASPGPSNPPSKAATPSGDSFANLVSFSSSNSNKNLTLLEQQKRLQEEKAKKEAENKARFETQYGGQNSQFWDSLERGGSNKPTGSSTVSSQQRIDSPDEDDLLAAFNASAPVDASTHFPVPSPSPSPQIALKPSQSATDAPSSLRQEDGMSFNDDDDPFGLNQLKPRAQPAPQSSQTDDDDFLGLLGKPVSELPPPEPPKKSPGPSERQRHSPSPRPMNGVDRAIAELVDMGFTADKASQALKMTSSGTDVQAAVGLLLTQAHEESRERSKNGPTPTDRHTSESGRSREQGQRPDRDMPSWMQPERSGSSRSRNDNRSPLSAEKDPSQIAVNFGNNLLKTANSLWKTGTKKVQQLANDFNADHDPSQPRWMREPSAREDHPSEHPPKPQARNDFTDEALLLESGDPHQPARNPVRPNDEPPARAGSGLRNQQSPAAENRMKQPAFMQQRLTPEPRDAKSRLSRFAAEEQSAQAYVSPARRKRPAAQPSAPKPVQRPTPSPSAARPARTSTPSTALPTRPKAPPRVIPQISQSALASTHGQREKAAAAYKRGDYAAAHEAFSAALSSLPEKHPIIIVIRSNHAMTALKIGEPKVAIRDADLILELIGPAKDAAEAWKQAVESGHGGSTSIQGRNRCEKAAGIGKPAAPKPSAAPARRPAPPAPKKASALHDLQGHSPVSGQSSEAVSRLRAANQAAERTDEEKFALTDSVDARLAAWKNGKQDNLRALLASLDTVLWPESGWKKINMSELIMPNKVKVQYMKGIAKVHPDKIPTDATTEQRMIAGSVFGVLNEAWDKFKAENNL
ncbi:hypothetical protein AOCH_004520 [Aspergillus ochraceoroseus]|uniref:UBA domain-containing protein n=1 Tax=Aspergillus ochraceoroseus TaxID=138278 RepID=A0A0F8VL81_9EURO|nr:hypothetical protein AOCH_004520 [Aspergillus ochraceoroseus]